MERAVGLGTIFVGTTGVPSGAPNRCVGLMAAAGMTAPRPSTALTGSWEVNELPSCEVDVVPDGALDGLPIDLIPDEDRDNLFGSEAVFGVEGPVLYEEPVALTVTHEFRVGGGRERGGLRAAPGAHDGCAADVHRRGRC